MNVATIRDLEQGRSSIPHGRTRAALASLVGPAPCDDAPVTRVEILGRLRVWQAALPADIGHGSHRVVLARLALTPGEPVHRDELVSILWAARPPASAVNMVQAYIGKVRRLLGARDGTAGPIKVELSGAGYELDMPEEAHDAGQFARLTESGSAGPSDLEAALDLWRGRPVEDIAELHEHPAGTQWERRRVAVAGRLARLAQQQGDPQRALPRLRQLAEVYPLDEALHQHLIETLAADSQTTIARLTYRAFADRLAAETGARPDQGLRDLHDSLRQDRSRSDTVAATVSISLLGPVTLTINGRPVVVPRSQCRGVLAFLALHAGVVIRATEIVEALWAGLPPPTAAAQVHSAIAVLRKIFHQAGLWNLLESTAGGYRLACPRDEIDVYTFETLLGEAREARETGDHSRVQALLVRAAQLWRGTPLGAAGGSFVEPQRSRLELARLGCLEDLAEARLAQGESAALVDEMRQLVDRYPSREPLRLILVRALRGCGRTLEALEAARAYRGYLAEEFGLDPGPELTKLETALLRGDAAEKARVTPSAARSSPAGATPAELPRRSRHLIGREAQLLQLNTALERLAGHPATIVITGAAGVGKTELALAWCHEAKHLFPDGQVFVALSGFREVTRTSPEIALEGMLRSLGVAAARIPGPLAQRTNMWRSLTAGKRLLVMIDDAVDSDQVRALLPADDSAVTVVTSRRRLSGLVVSDDAVVVPVEPLTGGQSRTLLSALTPGNSAAEVDAVARQCGGLPLALRIAGARLRLAPASSAGFITLLKDEGTRLSALSVDDSAVRPALLGSYHALKPHAAAMLHAVATHPGPRPSLAVCAAMTGLSLVKARESLEQLVDSHLVDTDGTDRYTLHDLVRLFARERTAGGHRLLRRAVNWYVHAGHQAGRPLRRVSVTLGWDVPAPATATLPEPTGSDEAVQWIDAEMANLEPLITTCDRLGWYDAVWRLVHAPTPLLGMRASAGKWTTLAELGRRTAGRDGNVAAEAFFHNALGIAAAFARRFPEAEKHFRTTLRLREQQGDQDLITASRLNLAAVHGDLGKTRVAVRELNRLADAERARTDSRWLAPVLNTLSTNLLRMGRHDECIRRAREAQQVATRSGDLQSAAHAERNLAEALAATDVPGADAAFQASAVLAQRCGDTRLEAAIRRDHGDLLARTGRPSPARTQWAEALRLFEVLVSDETESIRERLDGATPST